MSRRLFAACRSLDQERTALQRLIGSNSDFTPGDALQYLFDEDAYEEQLHTQRAQFAELEDESRHRIRAATREGFEAGQESEWRELIDSQPPVVANSSPGLLESATPDTYIAIDTGAPTPGI